MEFIPKDPILEFLPDTIVTIRKIYNLENGGMEQSLDILESWMKKQNHFCNKNFSREYLERTIIACKGSTEKAKMQIDKLCTLKSLLPQFFICNNVKSKLQEINEIICFLPLPKMTKDYHRIFFLKIYNTEFTSAHYMEFYKLVLAVAEYAKAHDYVNGVIIIEDLREANLMEIITKINFVEFQQFMTILTKGLGAKMKGFHVITPSKMIDLIMKTAKVILSPKLAGRVHVHQNEEELYQIVDKQLLPVDLGGNERSIKSLQAEWVEVLGSEEHEKYLTKMKASCTDESLRQTDKFNEQHMGLPGSFRTLTVD